MGCDMSTSLLSSNKFQEDETSTPLKPGFVLLFCQEGMWKKVPLNEAQQEQNVKS
jgi:hypothetical protein